MKWQENEKLRKEDIERILECNIADDLFNEALEHAKNKQAYIYRTTRRSVVLQPWYFMELTKEYVISLAFSQFTMDLCRVINMEKEHPANNQGALTDIHIVPVSAL